MNKAIVRLIAGFRRFKEKYFLQEPVYEKLATEGQAPKILLIGCSDSRVDPAIITDAAPGELFVVRNVANLVPPCEPAEVGYHGTSAAIEFAVKSLKVEYIIVLGHRQCGGIRALMGEAEEKDTFIGHWMKIASEAKMRVLKENPNANEEVKWRLGEMEGIKVSLTNLRSFPFVKDAVEAGLLKLIGVYFDLEQGELWQLDEDSQRFLQLET